MRAMLLFGCSIGGEAAGLYFACVALSYVCSIRLWLYMFYDFVGFVFALWLCVGVNRESAKGRARQIWFIIFPIF